MTRPATLETAAIAEPASSLTRCYEGFPLEAVLERVHAVHGADATITGAERVRRGGIGGFFAREVFQVTVQVAAPAERVAAPLASDPTDEIDPEDVDGALALPDATTLDDEREAEIWALLAQARATVAAEPVAGEPVAGERGAPAPVIPLPVNPSPAPPSPPAAASAPVDVAQSDVAPSDVARVVPAGVGRLGTLLDRYSTLPAAPPLPSAGVVAVVGARVEALQAAARIAEQLGVPADDVVVAAPSAPASVPTEEDTVRFAASVRFRCRPVAVVAVELVAGRLGHDWARAVLAGLQAEQVRFAVSAAEASHGSHVLAALGGAQAVDLVAVDAADPTDALDLGVPVATLDGRVATPELWAAATLAAQLREAAMVDLSAGMGR